MAPSGYAGWCCGSQRSLAFVADFFVTPAVSLPLLISTPACYSEQLVGHRANDPPSSISLCICTQLRLLQFAFFAFFFFFFWRFLFLFVCFLFEYNRCP